MLHTYIGLDGHVYIRLFGHVVWRSSERIPEGLVALAGGKHVRGS